MRSPSPEVVAAVEQAERAAGRELDGRTHDAMPGVAPC